MDLLHFQDHVKRFNTVFSRKYDPLFAHFLVAEEAAETCKAAIKNKPKEEIEDEWADTMYVLLGWAHQAGFDTEAAMLRVALKNQKKIDNADKCVVTPSGKVLKPEEAEAYKQSLTKEVVTQVRHFDRSALAELKAHFDKADGELLHEARREATYQRKRQDIED